MKIKLIHYSHKKIKIYGAAFYKCKETFNISEGLKWRIIHHFNNLILDDWQPIIHYAEKLLKQHFHVKIRKSPSVVTEILGRGIRGKDQGNDAIRIFFSMTVLVKKWGASQFFMSIFLVETSIPSHCAQLEFTWFLPDAELLLIAIALIQKVHTRSPSVCLTPASGPGPRRSRLGCLLWALGLSASGPARCWFSSPIPFGRPTKTMFLWKFLITKIFNYKRTAWNVYVYIISSTDV